MELVSSAINNFKNELIKQQGENKQQIVQHKDITRNFLVQLQLVKSSYNNSVTRVEYLRQKISNIEELTLKKKATLRHLSDKLQKYNKSSRDLLLPGLNYRINSKDKISLAVKLSNLQNNIIVNGKKT
jgi:hypothetical protein